MFPGSGLKMGPFEMLKSLCDIFADLTAKFAEHTRCWTFYAKVVYDRIILWPYRKGINCFDTNNFFADLFGS